LVQREPQKSENFLVLKRNKERNLPTAMPSLKRMSLEEHSNPKRIPKLP